MGLYIIRNLEQWDSAEFSCSTAGLDSKLRYKILVTGRIRIAKLTLGWTLVVPRSTEKLMGSWP